MEIELLEEPKTSTELTVQQRAAVALNAMQARIDLSAQVKKSENVKEIKNEAGRAEAHSYAMALVKSRTTLEKVAKAKREDATAFSKAVIALEKELLQITTPEETRLLALRDAWDQARAAEKAEAERIELERITRIHLRIADIREAGNLALQCRTSAMVESLIEKMTGQQLDGFDEFTEEAHNTRTATLARMKEISDIKFTEEQERARIKAEQDAEAARLAAERAELDRLFAEAAEAERIAAQERAEQEAKAQAARDAEEAAAKAILDAEALRLADERAAFEAEQAAARAAAQAQADELDRQRAEFQAEVDRRAAEAKALETTVTEIQPEQVEVTGPAPLGTVDTDPFMQADGGDELDDIPGPSDAEVIDCAVIAIVVVFGLSYNDALNRLAEVQEWIPVEVEA